MQNSFLYLLFIQTHIIQNGKLFSLKKCLAHYLKPSAFLLEEQISLEERILCPQCESKNLDKKIVKIEVIAELIQTMEKNKNEILQQELSQRYQQYEKLENAYFAILENGQHQTKDQNSQCNTQITEDDLNKLCIYFKHCDNSQKQQNHEEDDTIKIIKEKMAKFQESLLGIDQEQFQKQNKQIQNKQILIQEQQITKKVKTEGEIIWKFSKTFKHQNIQLSENCKTAQSMVTEKPEYPVCLCEQAIPQNGIWVIQFKIIELSNILAGISQKNSLNKDYKIPFQTTTNDNNNWCYFINENGYTYSHQQDGKETDFRYFKNDIITMEVNQQNQTMTWINASQNNQIDIRIPEAVDLYFCFRLQGKNEIELL